MPEIVQLPAATLPLDQTELLIVWQANATKQTPVSSVIAQVPTAYSSLTVGGNPVPGMSGAFTSGDYLKVSVTAGVATIVDAGTAGSFSTLTTTGAYGPGVAALDLHAGNYDPAAIAIWIPNDAPIVMNLDVSNPATFRWDTSVSRWKFSYAGTDVASIDESGNLRIAGIIMAGATP